MKYKKALKYIERANENSTAIILHDGYKGVAFSDWHQNSEGNHNENAKNIDVLRNHVIPYYVNNKYEGFISEWFDLWEAGSWKKIWEYTPNQLLVWSAKKLIRKWIIGNHSLNIDKELPAVFDGIAVSSSIKIYNANLELIGIVQHGNAADFWNKGTKITNIVRGIVYYLWKPINWLGGNSEPKRFSPRKSPAKANEVERHFVRYGIEQHTDKPFIIIIGHTHKAELYYQDGCIYANSGSWTGNEIGGECIELEPTEIRLIRWNESGERTVVKTISLC